MSKTWKWIIIGVVAFILIACAVCGIAGGTAFLFGSGDIFSKWDTKATDMPAELGQINPTEEVVLEESTPVAAEEGDIPDNTPVPTVTPVPGVRSEFDDYAPIMAEAWQLANQYFVVQPLDGELLIAGAIRGMQESLPMDHPMYLEYDPEAYTV